MSYPLTALMPRDCIRPARQEEAGEIARLFLISSDGLAAYIWSKADAPGLSLEEIGAARYARTNTAFSFENYLVAVRGHRIAGMVHAFPMEADASGVEETDPVLRPYAKLEDTGSLYVSGLAVHDRYRGQGIGGELMDRFYAVARSRGLPLSRSSASSATKSHSNFTANAVSRRSGGGPSSRTHPFTTATATRC